MRKNVKQMILIAGLIVLMMMLGLLWSVNVLAADTALQWDASSDAVTYNVYQADRIGDKTTAWQMIGGTSYTTFVVTNLDDNNYAWLVTAVDESGNESFVSNMVERYDRTPPSAPLNLRK